MRLDLAFNQLVASACRNEFAVKTVVLMAGLSRRFFFMHKGRVDDLEVTAEAHARVAEAIADGDAGHAMSCACVHAHHLMKEDSANRGPQRLADLFCRHSRSRVKQLFGDVFNANDSTTYNVAQEVLRGEHAWLEPDMLV
jgi:DNA-binding GntR family transcriptional regulator